MVCPVVIRADEHEVLEVGGAAVFPVHDVMGMKAACCPTAGNHTAMVAVFQGAAQSAADGPRGPSRANGLTVAFQPYLAGGVAQEVLAFLVGEHRTQMQCGDAVLDVQMHCDRGVLTVRAARHFSVPAGFDQAHEGVDIVRERPRLNTLAAIPVGVPVILAVVTSPVGDQPIAVRSHRGVEFRCFHPRQPDPPRGVPVVLSLVEEPLRFRFGFGSGAWFEFDRGTELLHGGVLGQLDVVRIRTGRGALGQHPDLIQGQPALAQSIGAAGEFLAAPRHSHQGFGVGR